MKFLKLLSVIMSLVILLCSCGASGSKGESGSADKDGASFFTGKGAPSSTLGEVGDSYLDLTLDEWGFYVKEENGWKLMGYIEVEPAPLTISELNGTYVLSHVVSDQRVYNIGDVYAGMTLSRDMIHVELNEGVGNLAVNFGSLQATNITCTIEYDNLIMICENAINLTGEPGSVYELSIVQGGGGDYVEDGQTYVVLEAYGDYYYVKKIN